MNNGRVRIYELSRELNLDNKDILAVCEQLNIAVKSHSSTITEEEAKRIRAHSEKYVASHSKTKTSSPSKQKPRSEEKAEAGERQNRPKQQQQILEVRQQNQDRSEPKQQKTGNGPSSPQVLVPPQSSQGNQRQDSARATMLNRPIRINQNEATATTELKKGLAETPQTAGAAKSSASGNEEKPSGNSQSSPKEKPVAKGAEPPRLISPPVRPSASANSGQAGGGGGVVKPVLKRPQGKEGAGANKSEQEKASAAGGPKSESGATTAPRPAPRGEGAGPAPTKPKRQPELQRPQRPNEPIVTAEIEEAAAETEEETEEIIPLLVRPTPPRPPKRNKKRDLEEEDLQDFPEKPGKSGPKAKRRSKPIEEDEDDLESELEELPETVQVSLSIARPAKQKNRPAQARTSAVAAPAKAKKAATSPEREGAAKSGKNRNAREQEVKKQRPEKVTLTDSMTVRELAELLVVPETEIVKILFFKGMAVNITQTLDLETASLVARELGVEVETAQAESEARKNTEMLDEADMENLQPRPPVVTIMGHVDHGKTTLLDAIRKTKVAQGEAGGITQHIGAYHVDVEHNGKIQQVVFLDTPGHEAFTAMRARGARVTDIAVLVVAADDGVRPQTIEAISHAKAAGVPIIVAINKIDKEQAQPERVKQELTEYGLVPEEWGGQTIMVPVSAIKGENLDTLLEMILLVAEVEELSANPNRPAKGTVIEAHLDKAKGPVATLLVQNGTLRVGDILVAGSAFGKVRAMVDDRGRRVEVATPSFAVEVLGLSSVPAAGDEFEVFLDEKEARALADKRAEEQRQSRLQQAMAARRVTLNSLSARAQEGQLKELNLILKADVQGSVEAILGALRQLPQNEVQIRVLLAAPGEITETDVDLAAASDAVIIGFNTTFATGARSAADAAGVDVREYNIIYNLLDDIQGAMEGLLEPELVEEHLGQAEVRAVFPISKGVVAGCYVQSGKVIRNCKVRVRRNGQVIHEGNLDSLKRMKEDVKEVNFGFECGIGLDNFHNWAVGDIIEAFRMVTKRRTLSPN